MKVDKSAPVAKENAAVAAALKRAKKAGGEKGKGAAGGAGGAGAGAGASSSSSGVGGTGNKGVQASGVRDTMTIDSIIRDGSDGEAIAEVEMRNIGSGSLPKTEWGYAFTLRRVLTIKKSTGATSDTLEAFKHRFFDKRGNEITGDPFAPGVTIGKITKDTRVLHLSKSGEPLLHEPPKKRQEWIRRELQSRLNVSASNPLMIMDQETSKSFFTGSVKDKYRFFMEATGLQRAFEVLQDTVTKLAAAKAAGNNFKTTVNKKREDYMAKKGLADALQGLQTMHNEIRSLEVDSQFAAQEEEEKKLEEEKANDRTLKDMTKLEIRLIPQTELEIEDLQKKTAEALQAVEQASKVLIALQEEANAKEKEFDAAQPPLHKAIAEAEQKKKALDKATKAFQYAQKDLKTFEVELNARNTQSLRAAYRRKLEAAHKKEETTEAALKKADEFHRAQQPRFTAAQKAQKTASDEAAALRAVFQRASSELGSIKSDLKHIESDFASKTQAVKDHFAAVEAAKARGERALALEAENDGMRDWTKFTLPLIQDTLGIAKRILAPAVAAGRFKHPPLNPLASYLRVHKTYAQAFDSVFFKTILGITVDHADDARVFTELMEKAGKKLSLNYSVVAGYDAAAPKTTAAHAIIAGAGGSSSSSSSGAGAVPSALTSVPNFMGMRPRVSMAELDALLEPCQQNGFQNNRVLKGHRLVDFMSVESDWAFNVILERIQPHKIIVAETEEELRKLLELPDGSPRKGISYGLTANGDRLVVDEWGVTFRPREYATQASVLTRPLLTTEARAKQAASSDKPKTLQEELAELKADFLEDKAKLEANLAEVDAAEKEARANYAQAEKALKQKQAEFNQVSNELAKAKERLDAANGAAKKARQELSEIQDEGEPEEDDEEDDRRRRAELEANLRNHEEALAEAQGAFNQANEAVKQVQATIKRIEGEMAAINAKANSKAQLEVEKRLKDAKKAEEEKKVQLGQLQKFLADLKVTAEQKQQQFAQREAQLKASREELESATGRDAVTEKNQGKTSEEIAHLHVAAKKRFDADSKKLKRTGEEARAICDMAAEAEAAYMAAKAELEANQANIDDLTNMKSAMIKGFLKDRRLVSVKIARNFAKRMASNGAQGLVEFSHADDPKNKAKGGEQPKMDEGEIRVMVAPDKLQRYDMSSSSFSQGAGAGDFSQRVDRGALQDAATLSGGEKSVSTLNLLSSIAKFCNLPLRAIDEFDVFQDEKNRKESLNTLLEQGKDHDEQGRFPQFILLTCHDISSAVDLKDPSLKNLVKVFRLPDPREARSSAMDASDHEGGDDDE